MERLPFWRPTKGMPASYDSESATTIEMVAKLYSAMSSLIDEYNTEIQKLNDEFQNYENDVNQSNECFKTKMIEMMNDFVDTMNIINDRHTKEINEAIDYMKNGLDETIETTVQDMVKNGELNNTILNAIGDYESQLNVVKAGVQTVSQHVTDLDESVQTLQNMEHLTIQYDETNESFIIQ